MDADHSRARFELEHNLVRYSARGLKSGSTAFGADVTLLSHRNRAHQNWTTGHLVQSGVEGGSSNTWVYLFRENEYWKNGETNVWMSAADEGGPSDDNVLLAYSINERVTEQLGTGLDHGDYKIADASSFGNEFPSTGNQTSVLFSGVEIGRLVLSDRGTDADNDVFIAMTDSEVDRLELEHDPDPGGLSVWGSRTDFLAANTVGELVAIPAGADLCSFFIEGC